MKSKKLNVKTIYKTYIAIFYYTKDILKHEKL